MLWTINLCQLDCTFSHMFKQQLEPGKHERNKPTQLLFLYTVEKQKLCWFNMTLEHDPELDSEDQNILAIETTDTLDNSIDNSNPTFDNEHNSSISDCTDIKQTVDNNDIGIQMNQRLKPLMTICKTKQITLTMKIKIILNLNPQKLFRLTTIP